MSATDRTHTEAPRLMHRGRIIVLALFAALFSFGCMTWSTMVEVTRTEDGQHLIGTNMKIEFNKRLWDELKEDERAGLTGILDPLKQKGWKVDSSDGGRIVSASRDPANPETLRQQGWTVTEQQLETGRVMTATIGNFGMNEKPEDVDKEAIRDIVVIIDESDPSQVKYTYRATVFIDASEQAPTGGSESAPPTDGEEGWGGIVQEAVDQDPDLQRLEQALKDAGPPKVIVGTSLPGIIDTATINGEAGGQVDGGTVQWTIDAEKSGTYNLEATATGADMELVIKQFDIEGEEVNPPDADDPAYPVTGTLKVNAMIAGRNKQTGEEDNKKLNPIDVRLFYDDEEIDKAQTDGEGNVSFTFTPRETAAEGVTIHQVKIVASKQRLKDINDVRSIHVYRGKKEDDKPTVDLSIDHIEVVQVIQTKDNSIPLVAGKKTVVRVFLKGTGDKSGVISNVRGSVFVWPEGKSEVEVSTAQNIAISVVNDAEPRRDDTNSSLNFVIPRELTGAGVFSIKAVVNPSHQIDESNFDNNELTQPFEFIQRNGLRVGFVPIGYLPPGKTEWAWPGTNIGSYGETMQKLFPAADGAVQYYQLPFRVRAKRLIATDDDGEELNWSLREFYDRMDGDKPDIMIGWLPKDYASTFTFGGLAETVMSGQVAHVALAVDYLTDYSSKHVLPHEVGHDLGLEHTATTGDSDCRVSENSHPGYWPSEYHNSAAINEIGFDTTTMAVIPGTFYDLMAYCSEQKTWLSTFHYKKLFGQNLRPQGTFVTTGRHMAWVRGWASLKGDAARLEMVRPPDASGGTSSPLAGANTAGRAYSPGLANSIFLPLVTGRTGAAGQAAQREGEGNHCLQFKDAAGALLYERCFDLTFKSAETSEPLEGSGFVVDVPDTPGVARVVLVRNDGGQTHELTSLQPSKQAPTLSITSPRSGDRWAGEHTITWSATDPDSDASSLRYDIQYSPDGKKSWYPLEVGSHDTSYTFSTEEILPSDQTYIRVTASDGFNTTSADVGPLAVPQQPNSPQPPPAAWTDSVSSQATNATRPGGLPSWGMTAIITGVAGVGLLIIVGFGIARSRRRNAVPAVVAAAPVAPVAADTVPEMPSTQAYSQPTTVLPPTSTTTTYYQQPQPQPPPQPVQPTQPMYQQPAPNSFQGAQMQFGQLQAELAARRITPQQFEAAVNSIRVQDQYGRYWMLGAYDGQWYIYDGHSWVRAVPS